MRTLATVAACILIVSPAVSKDKWPMEVEYAALANYWCRGSNNQELAELSCKVRDIMEDEALKKGWCYGSGKKEYVGAQNKWHKCTKSSYR